MGHLVGREPVEFSDKFRAGQWGKSVAGEVGWLKLWFSFDGSGSGRPLPDDFRDGNERWTVLEMAHWEPRADRRYTLPNV